MTGHHLITPTHRSIRKYYENVAALRAQGVLNEMSVRSPFESLLQETARLKDWTFIAELSGKSGGALIRPDGTLRTAWRARSPVLLAFGADSLTESFHSNPEPATPSPQLPRDGLVALNRHLPGGFRSITVG